MKPRKSPFLIILLLFFIVGIGYAALSANLKINGSSGVKSGKWIIYFDRIQNESGVVSTDTKITNNKTQVDFNITLTKPGDYYEFDVDTVNDGTIDAMIESTEFGEVDSSVKDVVTFDVTYKDGTKIKKCDILAKNSRKTITVKVHYKQDITEEELITNQKELNLNFKINYVQNTTCENKPTLIVDPNGGTYNGSSELTEIKVNSNSDTILDAPTKDDSEFLYFKTESGTPLEKDENGKTTVHVDDEDVKVIANWRSTPKYVLTIDPNGGEYKGSTKNTTTSLEEGETLTLENPIRDGYIFDSWEEVTETNSLNENIVTMPALPVTVKAVWKTEADYVARINTKYYTTIQKAFDAAVDGDTVHLLKSTTENGNNTKNISFNLGGFTVTGTITNSGTLTIDNGRIENVISSPFVNTGTVNVGTKDGNMVADSIVIFGGENVNGLTQNGTFNFYDGYIEGKLAVTGGYNELEEGYYYIVDHDDDNNCQKAYLSPDIDAIVKIVENGNDIYFKLLQDAIDMTTNDNPNIYAIKDFETSKAVTITSNQKVVFDIKGYKVLEGAQITNNGEFTIVDTKEEKGVFSPSLPIVNNNKLNITNAVVTQSTTAGNLIENSGNLNITNSTLTANNGYALDIKTGGNLVFDSDTTITANSYGIYNEAVDPVTITGGNIVGINNIGSNLTINNSYIENSTKKNYMSAINSTAGNIYLNNINVKSTDKGLNVSGKNSNATITGGTYNTTSDGIYFTGAEIDVIGVEVVSTGEAGHFSGTTSNIKNSLFTATGTLNNNQCMYNSSNLTLDNTIITSNYSQAFYSYSGTVNVINNTKVTSEKNVAVGLMYGNITLNETVEIISNGTNACGSYNGMFYIKGATIKGKTSAISSKNSGKFYIYSGTIIGETSEGINFGGSELYVYGGKIQGKTYGIKQTGGSLIIGKASDDLSISNPEIIGETYGVYIENGNKIEIYDGILEGKTGAYYGNFLKVLENHYLFETTKEIDGETYNVAYLVVQKDFIQVGDTKFNSLQAAFDAVTEENNTITLIEDAELNEEATFNSNVEAIFDINGHILINKEQTTNNGNLTITDSSRDVTGKLQGIITETNKSFILNKGTITIEKGNLSSKGLLIKNDSASLLHIKNGNITADYNNNMITTVGNAKIIIDDGNFSTEYSYPIINQSSTNSTLIINGGTFISTSTSDSSKPISVSTNAVVKNASFSAKSGMAIEINGTGSLIENITAESVSGIAVKINGSTTIKNVTSHSINSYAIEYWGSNTNIEGGTYISDNSSAVNVCAKNINLISGYFKGKTYGVTGRSDRGEVNIGIDDNAVTEEEPVIVGKKAGINLDVPTNFYDGIFKGIENSYIKEFNKLAKGYYLDESEELIDGETYQTVTLKQQEAFLKVGDKTFVSLQDAIDEIEETGLIEVIGNGVIGQEVSFTEGKNITLDLNGHTIYTTQPLNNYSNLTLKDSSGNNSGKIYVSQKYNLINNYNSLTINSGTYEINNTSNSYNVITQTNSNYKNASITINGGIINALDNATDIRVSYGSLLINDGIITSNKGYGIAASYYALVTINNGTIETENGKAVDFSDAKNTAQLNINNGSIISHGNNYALSTGNYLTFNISGGNIHSDKAAAIKTYSNTIITGGTITSDKDYAIWSLTSLTLGNNSNNVDTSKPIINGETYGVYKSSGKFNFYDGILKGKTAAYYGTIDEFATGSVVTTDTEEIDGITKKIAYLVEKKEIIINESTNIKYKDFSEAFEEANNDDELRLIDDAISYYNVTIPNKKITINLDSHSINFIKPMINNGEITIIDRDPQKEGTLKAVSSMNVLTNNNYLELKDLNIEKSNSNYKYFISNNSETIFDNVTSNIDYYLISNVEDSNATATIKNSNITSTQNTVFVNNNSCKINLIHNTANYKGNYLYNYGNFEVNDENVTSNSSDSDVIYSNSHDTDFINKITNSTFNVGSYGINIISNNNGNNIQASSININGHAMIYNKSDSNLTITNFTHIDNYNSYDTSIVNEGNMDIDNYTLTSSGMKMISNSGTLVLKQFTGTIDTPRATTTKTAISNSGNINLIGENQFTINSGGYSYGINNSNGTVNNPGSNFDITGSNAYGIYITGGEVTLGENENPAIVSTTNPEISAIGTTSGVGVKKLDGIFNYYDGIIIGSHEAKPEAPTDIPDRYRVVFNTNLDGYKNCILEYVP